MYIKFWGIMKNNMKDKIKHKLVNTPVVNAQMQIDFSKEFERAIVDRRLYIKLHIVTATTTSASSLKPSATEMK